MNNEMIAAKLPYQRLRCLKICKSFRYKLEEKKRRIPTRNAAIEVCTATRRERKNDYARRLILICARCSLGKIKLAALYPAWFAWRSAASKRA
jgi:hypothetical protein